MCASFSNSWCHCRYYFDLVWVAQKQTCCSHTILASYLVDLVQALIIFSFLTVLPMFLHPQMRLCNPARWPAGSTTPCLTMGQVWREGLLLLLSASTWSHPAFTHMPKARISGWMGSFAEPLARTVSVMASHSAIGLSTSMRRFVFFNLCSYSLYF